MKYFMFMIQKFSNWAYLKIQKPLDYEKCDFFPPPLLFHPWNMEWFSSTVMWSYCNLNILSAATEMLFLLKNIKRNSGNNSPIVKLAGNGTNSIPWVFCTSVVQHAFSDWQLGGRIEAAPSHGHRVPSSSAHDSPHC